jgi:hypothetical protein
MTRGFPSHPFVRLVSTQGQVHNTPRPVTPVNRPTRRSCSHCLSAEAGFFVHVTAQPVWATSDQASRSHEPAECRVVCLHELHPVEAPRVTPMDGFIALLRGPSRSPAQSPSHGARPAHAYFRRGGRCLALLRASGLKGQPLTAARTTLPELGRGGAGCGSCGKGWRDGLWERPGGRAPLRPFYLE